MRCLEPCESECVEVGKDISVVGRVWKCRGGSAVKRRVNECGGGGGGGEGNSKNEDRVWLLGFEPRSPRPQRGILTTKLQPPVIIATRRRARGRVCAVGCQPPTTLEPRFWKSDQSSHQKNLHWYWYLWYSFIYPGIRSCCDADIQTHFNAHTHNQLRSNFVFHHLLMFAVRTLLNNLQSVVCFGWYNLKNLVLLLKQFNFYKFIPKVTWYLS